MNKVSTLELTFLCSFSMKKETTFDKKVYKQQT